MYLKGIQSLFAVMMVKIFSGRTGLVLKGTLAIILSRIISILASLVSTAVMARIASKEAFGLWSLLSTMVILAGSLDFGLGQGLRNQLTILSIDSSAEAQRIQRERFLSVFYTLIVIMFVGFVVDIAGLLFAQWSAVFGISEPLLQSQVNYIIFSVIALILLNLPLSLNYNGFLAYQETHWRSVVDIAQSIIALICILMGIALLSIDQVIIGYFGAYVLTSILGMWLFLNRRHWSIGKISCVTVIDNVRQLFKISSAFWLVAVTSIFVMSIDSLMASSLLGISEYGEYSLFQKMFSLFVVIHFALLTPLWSAFTEASARDDWQWIRANFYRALVVTIVLFVGGAVFLAITHHMILLYWVNKNIANTQLVMIMGFKYLIFAWSSCCSVLLSSLNVVKRQLVFSCIATAISVPICYSLGVKFGIIGIVLGITLAVVPCTVSNSWEVFRLLKNQK